MPPASPRCCATATTTCSRPILWSEWISPPFEPTVRDGNLYARGAADDKGQMYCTSKPWRLCAPSTARLPVNLKFLIEGEEEVGGESVAKYVAENPAKLKADVALVSDTELYAEGIPTLCIGLRGLIYTEIEARGPSRDLHSGIVRRRRAQRGIRTGGAALQAEGRQRRISRSRACTTTCEPPTPAEEAQLVDSAIR